MVTHSVVPMSSVHFNWNALMHLCMKHINECLIKLLCISWKLMHGYVVNNNYMRIFWHNMSVFLFNFRLCISLLLDVSNIVSRSKAGKIYILKKFLYGFNFIKNLPHCLDGELGLVIILVILLMVIALWTKLVVCQQ